MIVTSAVMPPRARPLRLPALESADLRVRNVLHQRRQPWCLPWEGRSLAWSVTAVPPVIHGTAWQLVLDWDGDAVRLVLPGHATQHLLNLLWPGDPWPSDVGPSPVLWQALYESLVAAWRRDRPTLRPARLRVVAVREETVSPAHTVLGWSLCAGSDEVRGLLALDSAAAVRLSELLRPLPVQATSVWTGLPMTVRLQAGWTHLLARELAATLPGDVLLLDGSHLGGERQQIRLDLGGGLVAQGRRHAEGWLIDQGVHGVLNETDPSDHPRHDDMARLDDIPIRITFDLGDRTVGLGELQALMPGYVFNLGRDPRACVCIRANGQLIGEGELVEIDGRIGVTVLRLTGSDLS